MIEHGRGPDTAALMRPPGQRLHFHARSGARAITGCTVPDYLWLLLKLCMQKDVSVNRCDDTSLSCSSDKRVRHGLET